MNIATQLVAKPMPTGLTIEPRPADATKPAGAAARGTPATDEAIRLSAYLKWLAAGRPGGDGVEFWLAAEEELLSKAANNGGKASKRPSKPR